MSRYDLPKAFERALERAFPGPAHVAVVLIDPNATQEDYLTGRAVLAYLTGPQQLQLGDSLTYTHEGLTES